MVFFDPNAEREGMTHAICVRCGAMKFGCLVPCKACGQVARTARQMAYSYLLSEHFFDASQLREWSKDVLESHILLPVMERDEEERWIAEWGHRLPSGVGAESDMLEPARGADGAMGQPPAV